MSQPLTQPLPSPTTVSSLPALAAPLDHSAPDVRLAWLSGLVNRQLEALYDLSEAGPPLVPEDLLSAGVTRAVGNNGMPIFHHFEKRFAKVGDEIVGYNHTGRLLTWLVGAGHFIVRPSEDRAGEVWIDYTVLPRETHPEFPPLSAHHRLFSALVYGDMIDRVRRISTHLLIGRSFKPSGAKGLNGGATFALLLPAR